MPISIFNVPQSDSASGGTNDIVGRFRSGAQVNNRPMALTEWRVTSDDPAVIEAMADLLGGNPTEWNATGDDRFELYSETNSVDILLDGPDSVRTSMVIWGRAGKIHECDGQFLMEDGKATSKACEYASLSLKDHKEQSKVGRACEPSVQVYFRLADAPELGRFKFFSGSWSLAESIGKAEAKLAKIGGPAKARLTLERVEYTNSMGKAVAFTKPVLEVAGAAEEVAA